MRPISMTRWRVVGVLFSMALRRSVGSVVNDGGCSRCSFVVRPHGGSSSLGRHVLYQLRQGRHDGSRVRARLLYIRLMHRPRLHRVGIDKRTHSRSTLRVLRICQCIWVRATWLCYERNFSPINFSPNRTYVAGRTRADGDNTWTCNCNDRGSGLSRGG